MSESKLTRAVVVEYDFAAMAGADILFDVAKKVLADADVALTPKLEALYLVGNNCQGALRAMLSRLGKSGSAADLAKRIVADFDAAVTARFADGMTAGFKAFVKTLTDRGLKVVLATRGDAEKLKAAAGDLAVTAYKDASTTYGGDKWDAWHRVLNEYELIDVLTVGVAGSGPSLHAALVAGVSGAAVVHDRVAYQDFGGADVVAQAIDAALAKEVLAMLHLA